MKKNAPLLEPLIDDYLICCATEGKSPKTIEFYSTNLKRFNKFLEDSCCSRYLPDIGVTEARKFIRFLQVNNVKWRGLPSQCRGSLSPFSVQGYARAIKATYFFPWNF